MTTTDPGTHLRRRIATACRLLAFRGLARETTGHVSARVDDDTMLIRCRMEGEAGLPFTTADAVKRVRPDGTPAAPEEAGEPPSELPIHAAIYAARPEVRAVVHAHPPAAVLCTLAELPLEPVFGGYDPNAMFLAWDGVPLFRRSCLIRDMQTAAEMVAVMGKKSACLLHGHGIVTVGASVEEAVIKAIQIETLASMTLECARLKVVPAAMGEADRRFFTRMRENATAKDAKHMADVVRWTWNHYEALLARHEGAAHPAG